MRRCILHLGTPKTGSSAIQWALWTNAAALERAGILYRAASDPAEMVFAHHRIAAGLRGGDKRERLPGFDVADLDALLANAAADTVVLSSEGFSHPRVEPDRLRALIERIRARGFAPTAVVYVRPQPPLADSSYTQTVKTFAFPGSFAEFLDKRLGDPSWTHGARLAPWIEAPGVELVVVPFTAETTGERIAEKMLAFGGVAAATLEAAGMQPAVRVNEAPGPMAVAAFRMLMRARPDFVRSPRHATARWAAAVEARGRGWYADRFTGLDAALAARVEAVYEEDNEAFAARFWHRSWREMFASDHQRRWQPNEIDLDNLPGETAEMLEAFVSAHG